MADTLEVFGTEYTNVAGFKATDDNGDTLVYVRGIDGDDLAYGVALVNSAIAGQAVAV